MADIYSNSNIILKSMMVVFNYLKKNNFTAGKDIEFEMALKRLMEFWSLNPSESALFVCIFIAYFDFSEKPVNIGLLSGDFCNSSLRFLEFREEFISLEEKGFIYSASKDIPDSNSKFYRVTEGVVTAILKNDKNLLQKELRVRDKNLKYPDEISHKELFYSNEIKNEIAKITEYLSNDKFEAIQRRLEEKCMPKGVCIMFYGESGTGKTESVYQLAKKTGRSIFHVDIGKAVSQWHGGTIKNLSNIFEKYNLFCKQSKMRGHEIPILLFNEADALFGKRLHEANQGSEIDENHTQSMLLDYIERQEGLVILTTNLEGNFDDAFERRFLFKLKFERPNFETKKKIWKNKISWLETDSVEQLASNYDFSGAEIENIVRKSTMDEVLTGNHPSVKEIEEYCKTEKFEKSKKTRIGFGC